MKLLTALGAAAGAFYGGPAGMQLGSSLGASLSNDNGDGPGGNATAGSVNDMMRNANNASLLDNAQMQMQQMDFSSKLNHQNMMFQQQTEQTSQWMKQINTLRDVASQQRKADDAVTKDLISSIK